jgi:23S rRNA pseudouridine1911/1915/1917 synthase
MKKAPSKGHRFSRELALIYEDDFVVAVDKPAGLTAVPVKNSEMPSAFSILQAELKRLRQHAYVVHRIDRFTSGVLLFAKTQVARDVMIKQFLAHKPVREYLAVVRGRLPQREGELVQYFRKEGMFQRLRPQSDREAARAELSYTVEKPLKGGSLVRVKLVTGLQNQIRVQFSAIGHPVVGDRKYHPEEAAERRIARVALHAARVQFVHPVTRESVTVEAALPGDFRALLQAMGEKR